MSTTKAVEKAYTYVRERTLSGVYSSGLRITEQEIADATGVSRTPVREALRRLQAEGFLTLIPNQGAAVTEWSAQYVDDIFELRALLEPYGAARAAERITTTALRELKLLAQRQYDEAVRQAPGFIRRIGELNSRFHRSLLEHSGNERLVAMMPALIDAPLVLKTFSKYEHAELVRSASHHVEIVSALEARDAKWAASVMRSHIQAAHVSFQQIDRGFQKPIPMRMLP
jgi:DNA-binding GntR family transcriptional regulator